MKMHFLWQSEAGMLNCLLDQNMDFVDLAVMICMTQGKAIAILFLFSLLDGNLGKD